MDLSKGEPFSIALFGIDSDAQRESAGGGERSDTIMILSVNPEKKTTEMISIPRDTQAEIVGRDTTEKNQPRLCLWWTRYGSEIY